jgi:hypothetical protein
MCLVFVYLNLKENTDVTFLLVSPILDLQISVYLRATNISALPYLLLSQQADVF